MKLNSAQLKQTMTQLDAAEVLPEDHPAVAQLNSVFGDHTFLVDQSGLKVLEPTEPPARGQGGGRLRVRQASLRREAGADQENDSGRRQTGSDCTSGSSMSIAACALSFAPQTAKSPFLQRGRTPCAGANDPASDVVSKSA